MINVVSVCVCCELGRVRRRPEAVRNSHRVLRGRRMGISSEYAVMTVRGADEGVSGCREQKIEEKKPHKNKRILDRGCLRTIVLNNYAIRTLFKSCLSL